MELQENFEYTLLKKLLFSGEYYGKVMPILQDKYFNEVGNKELFKLIKKYYNEYKQIPSLQELVAQVKNVPSEETRTTIVQDLKKVNATEEVQNTQFMLDETVKFVKEAIFYEALILGSDGVTEKSEAKQIKSRQLMEEMAKVSIDTDLGLSFDDIDEMIKYYQEKLIGVRTQHDELNKRLGAGFLPGTLSIILAASGVGKSLLMTDLVSGMMKAGKNCLLISMEMQDKEIMKRVHANALDLPINNLRELPEEVIRNAHSANSNVGKFYVKDYAPGQFSPLMLEQLLDSYKVEKGIEFDVVYLDYLGIMKSDLLTPSAGLYSYIKSIAEETRAVAVKRQIPIISASQLNRSATGNEGYDKADNSSVSDSIGTVQTADFMIFLLQNEAMKEESMITCKVTKNRFTGRTDNWNMLIDYTKMRFQDEIKPTFGMSETEVKQEIAQDAFNNVQTIQQQDKQNGAKDEITAEDIFAELGIES
jgi:replicative DNA helicase